MTAKAAPDPEAYDASILDRRSFIFLRFDATCLRAISFGRTHGEGGARTERARRHLHQHSAGLHVGSAAGHPARPPPAHGVVSVKRAMLKATNVKQCLAIDVPAFVAFYRAAQDLAAPTNSNWK